MQCNKAKKAFTFFVLVLIFAGCVPVKKVRLREVYEKLSDEISGANRIDTAFAPTLELTKKEKKKEEEVTRKMKARVFYGFKTRRAYARIGTGKSREVELFYVLKKPQTPNPFIKDIYWYHRKKRKVMVGPIDPKDARYAKLLHGPYIRKTGRQVLEEGIFYVGTKHGRWMRYDRANIVQDKRHFFKGWPKESEITYYDLDQKQPKEVIPIQFGRKEGEYFFYDEKGNVLKTGLFKENRPVGVWTEYYPNKKPKRQIQYPKNWWEDDVEPYVLREYDQKGKVVYDFRRDGPKTDSTTVQEGK